MSLLEQLESAVEPKQCAVVHRLEPGLLEEVGKARTKGYSFADIARALRGDGYKISEGALANHYAERCPCERA